MLGAKLDFPLNHYYFVISTENINKKVGAIRIVNYKQVVDTVLKSLRWSP